LDKTFGQMIKRICFGSLRKKNLFNHYTSGVFKTLSNPDFSKKIAIKSKTGDFTYSQLKHDSVNLLEMLPKKQKKKENISFLFNPGYEYVVANLAIWL
jgi:acyl-coenzyme A synthetase/AMP-(fatty) acid ligase